MKYILNWPSGAGGDFLLALMFLAKNIDAETFMLPRLNLWGHGSHSVLKYRTFKIAQDFDKQQKLLNEMPHGYVMQSHVMNQATLNLDNVRVVNVFAPNVFVEAYVGLLYKIKTVALPEDDIKTIYPENGYLNFAVNIDYYKLFELCDDGEIEKLYNAFDAKIENITQIKKILNLYHALNESILRLRLTEELVNRKLTVDIRSMDDIEFWLSQPLGKTLEDQEAIVKQISTYKQ